MCWHALSHENGSKRAKHRFGCHFGSLPFHCMEEEKEEDIQGYICTPDFTEASYLWQIPLPSKGVSLPPIQVSSSGTWVEFHENKRTDWFTRNRLKIRSRGNPATFCTTQFPASFMVAFGRNGFIQIAYTQSNAKAAFAFVVAFPLVVVLCINRPFSAGFDCILYSSSLALKPHPCTLTYIEIHTFLFSRKNLENFCFNTAIYTRSWKTVILFRRIYCSLCMPHAISQAIYNSFAPSFEPRRAKLGKTFAGEPETVRVWQTKLSHHALVCPRLAENLH